MRRCPTCTTTVTTDLQRIEAEAGEIVVRQGATFDGFFIVVEGEIEVRTEGHGADQAVNVLGPGQLFGDTDSLSDGPISATVRAITQATPLVIEKGTFRDLANRSTISAFENDLRQRLQGAPEVE